MLSKSKFQALAATTKTGQPTMRQVADNGGMPPAGKYKSTMNEYDHKRPVRPVVSRYSK